MEDQQLEKALELFKDFLRGLEGASRESETYRKARKFIEEFPRPFTTVERQELSALMRKAFGLPKDSDPSTEPFASLIPKVGWLHDYYKYTLRSEPPAVFHFMSALTVLGATLGRSVYFDKGFYRVYPNIATVLIAPTGRCRKTSATNVSLQLARAVGVNVLSERLTPEALVEGLGGSEQATGLVYAPELAVFLGRQKYLEGMVPLLTSLFDSPDVWKSSTIGRGDLCLSRVAVCMLAASTVEWFVEALPREAFSGGFMSRILFVVQEDTAREFALPERGEGHVWEGLREQLQEIGQLSGEVFLERDAELWYKQWYATHHRTPVFDAKFAGYHERKPDHMLRIAYLLRIANTRSLRIQKEDLDHALGILDWMEVLLPEVFDMVAHTAVGETHRRIVRQLKAAGGRIAHSTLLRKNQYYMTARAFAEAMITLKESGTVDEERTVGGRYYTLQEK